MTVINDLPLRRSDKWCHSPAWTLSPRIGRAEPALCICSCPSGEYVPPGATNNGCFKDSQEEAAHLYSCSAYLSPLLTQDNHDGFTVTFWDDCFQHFLLHIWQEHTGYFMATIKVCLTLKQSGKNQTQVGPRCTSDSPSTSWPSWVRHTQEVGVRTSSTNIYGGGKSSLITTLSSSPMELKLTVSLPLSCSICLPWNLCRWTEPLNLSEAKREELVVSVFLSLDAFLYKHRFQRCVIVPTKTQKYEISDSFYTCETRSWCFCPSYQTKCVWY